jgi:hypothetical protein
VCADEVLLGHGSGRSVDEGAEPRG